MFWRIDCRKCVGDVHDIFMDVVLPLSGVSHGMWPQIWPELASKGKFYAFGRPGPRYDQTVPHCPPSKDFHAFGGLAPDMTKQHVPFYTTAKQYMTFTKSPTLFSKEALSGPGTRELPGQLLSSLDTFGYSRAV